MEGEEEKRKSLFTVKACGGGGKLDRWGASTSCSPHTETSAVTFHTDSSSSHTLTSDVKKQNYHSKLWRESLWLQRVRRRCDEDSCWMTAEKSQHSATWSLTSHDKCLILRLVVWNVSLKATRVWRPVARLYLLWSHVSFDHCETTNGSNARWFIDSFTDVSAETPRVSQAVMCYWRVSF